MTSAFDVVVSFLSEHDLPFEVVKPGRTLEIDVGDDEAAWSCLFVYDSESEQVFFYSVCGLVPESRRPVAAEYITRVNSGLSIGNFEMDYEDGEVCCKTAADVGGLTVEPQMVDHLLSANLTATSAFAPGLLEVMEGRAAIDAYASMLARQ